MARIQRIRRYILIGILGAAAVCLLASSAAFLNNLTLVRAIFPYRLMWKPLGGDSEAYIAGLVHEAFHNYASRERFWRLQFQELKRISSHRGEIRFYYTGMAQAALLDWLAPEWKLRAFQDGVFLERMLREAVDES